MTDITELAQSLKAAANTTADAIDRLKAFPGDELIDLSQHEGEQVDIDITTLNEWYELSSPANVRALVEALEKAQTINAAAEKLVRCKGRYHSEQNYRALAALFGVNTPDLPPLDGESRTVKVPDFRHEHFNSNWGEHDAEAYPLYRHAQPAKSLELAGWQFKSVNGDWLGLIDEHGKNQAVREGCEVREVFAIADGVNDRDNVRREHAEWSQTTFGNVGPIGPLKHLSKEALEAASEPGDLSEWADMQFLMWDAQRRAGITDEQITQAMIEKLAVNKQREWPEPKDGEPRLHIKEQVAPVVPDERAAFNAWNNEDNLPIAGVGAKNAAWLAWQARAMLQAGNSPVIPEGYVMVPKEPTERMVIDGFESEPDEAFSEPEVWEVYQNMSGCEQAAFRARLCWAAMLAAAPQEVK